MWDNLRRLDWEIIGMHADSPTFGGVAHASAAGDLRDADRQGSEGASQRVRVKSQGLICVFISTGVKFQSTHSDRFVIHSQTALDFLALFHPRSPSPPLLPGVGRTQWRCAAHLQLGRLWRSEGRTLFDQGCWP